MKTDTQVTVTAYAVTLEEKLSFFFSFLFIPFIIFALLFFLAPSRESDPGSHMSRRLFPSPLRFVPCIFIARRFQLFRPSSARVELCLPTLRALSSSFFFFIFASKFKISPRLDSNSRINTISSNSSIRGVTTVTRPPGRHGLLYCSKKIVLIV